MYRWLWRQLPGGPAGKTTCTIILTAAFVTLLWFVIFPWLTLRLPLDPVMRGG